MDKSAPELWPGSLHHPGGLALGGDPCPQYETGHCRGHFAVFVQGNNGEKRSLFSQQKCWNGLWSRKSDISQSLMFHPSKTYLLICEITSNQQRLFIANCERSEFFCILLFEGEISVCAARPNPTQPDPTRPNPVTLLRS